MMSCLADRRSARFAGVFLLAFAMFASGCGRPDDEAWLRCVGFKQSGETISVLEGELNDATSSTVDIELENSSQIVGRTSGTGILVNRTRVDYRMNGFSPPSADYPVNLYISPPAEGKSTTATLTAFPLASKSLKQWLIDAGVSDPVVQLTARVTFYGQTDEGNQIETEASLGVELTNTGGGGTTPETKPTVFVFSTADASKLGDPGEFTVNRCGSVAAPLTVKFSTVGSSATSGVDYVSIGISVVIPAGEGSKTIPVAVLAAGDIGDTIKINLLSDASYTVGAPSSATLNIIP